ncbi:hypothetical protein [Thalassospira sp.]|uniref:hypothetical protein n=1 Tax=Thalassospira sp. TaxID=1912094 RepID=UPI00258044A8|nr:hypothetical protein [Thalassospira sp.]
MQWRENIRYIWSQFPWQNKRKVFKITRDHVVGVRKIDDKHVARDNALILFGKAAALQKKLNQNVVHIIIDHSAGMP